MKQLIVLCSMVLLGIFLYQQIMGNDENAMIQILSGIWRQSVEERTLTP